MSRVPLHSLSNNRQSTLHRTRRCIPVPGPLSIPAALQTTLRGREVATENINHNESFLLHTGQDGRLLVFCAGSELQVMHKSQVTGDWRFRCGLMTSSFVNYFSKTWISGSFLPRLWSHFDNVGLRTTNLAEGYHNSLNSRFGMPHPSLTSFLNWLQKYQFEVQCHGIQLAAGQPPKQRTAAYVHVDEQIQSAKLNYSISIGHTPTRSQQFFCIRKPGPCSVSSRWPTMTVSRILSAYYYYY